MKKNHFIQMISGLLAILLLFNCFIVQAESAKNQFSDVKETAWYYSAVEYAVKNGLMNGVGNGKFSPDGAASRAMLVTLLYRMEGEPKVSSTTPFTDLKADWYKAPIAWAYVNKIVNGTTNTTYSPVAPLTREQFATILYRYCKEYLKLDVSANAQLSGYPDHKSVSSYAKDAMIWANAEGLITGSNENGKVYLRPKQTATRAQMATIFQRFDQFLAEERAEQPAPEQPQPEHEQPQPEQPTTHTCDFSGIPTYKEGEDKHIYRCKVEGCDKKQEVSCTFSEQKIPATCTEQGKIIFTCGSCGYNQTVNDPAAPAAHSWKKEEHRSETHGKESKHIIACGAPGCTESYEEACTIMKTSSEPGTIHYSCSVCDYEETLPDQSGTKIKILNQNIRYDAGSDRGTSNDPRVRRYRFKALVEKYDPDIICLQEADPFWIAALPQDLGATYDMYYHYRQPVSGSDEACPILWKKDQYEKLAEGNFWLSDTPNQSSASFVPNYYPRVVNWVKLKDKSSGSIFVVHSTHLGFDYTAEHINKIRQLFVNSFQTHSDAYNILMGDFNISYGSDYYNIIVNETDLVDLRPIAIQMQASGHCTLGDLRNGTYNGFNSPNGSSWIDFILAPPRNDVAIDYYGVCYDQIAVPSQNIAEGYVSDHFGVLTEIRIGTEVSYEQYWNPKT